jgi:hypothetical protein
MKFLTRNGFLIEEPGTTYVTDTDPDLALGLLRAAACASCSGLGRARKYWACKPFLHKLKKRRLLRGAASTSTALTSMPRCAAPPIRGRKSNTCAVHGRDRASPPLLPRSSPISAWPPDHHLEQRPGPSFQQA